ncbi:MULTISPECIES: primosomal protein N' [unclassified Polynucleobacter]|uniref:replication restart helicase PriA n=1 Tax=unclassified Polynucleobacter TaxID=2640945 RepID=UPI0008BB566B|nr:MULTISPECIES: primosomal protein N' [unclassified Polynucleobacter]OHC09164.1 MAG: primosomal protein N' [Polynucleobacter sp. GWA2_45_21]HBK43172.1 primosomal protein N' [Polynucleobacter sp.]
MTPHPIVVQIVIDKPLAQGFDYLWDAEKLGKLPEIGNVVEVPFSRGKEIGLVIKVSNHSDYEIEKLKSVERLAPLPAFDPALLRLMNFASQYYIHALGETILPVIPQMWKKADNWEKIPEKLESAQKSKKKLDVLAEGLITQEQLNPSQKNALQELLASHEKENQFRAILLQGQTGSGKTAVFLNWLASILHDESAQVLLLVPEINLTPQLERRVKAYFPDKKMAVLHSGVSEKKRGVAWYEAMTGKAKIILGTRLAALTLMPNLRAIVVDEEHDPSYKQQDGTRYSARDLAIWRAHDQKIPILLSSATPSLETWLAAQSGRYEYIRLDQRAQGASLPSVHLINTRDPQNQFSPGDVGATKEKSLISKTLANAITKTLAEKKQSLILINRRGYAPVLSCSACNWLSKCAQCSTYTVMHKAGALGKRSVLSCHHCGLAKPVPQFCPDCGNADLKTLGHGTQKLEDAIEDMWPQARVLRVDTDSSRKSKGAEALFQEIHNGNVDIVVGTQMIAKGHDYQNIGLVAVLDADSRLYSADFRAAERLFAQLVQVAGRAGRSGSSSDAGGDIYIETQYPESPVFQYLLRHDIDGFLAFTASEREEAKLPPYSYQALIHAEGKSLDKAIQFLNELKARMRSKGMLTKELKAYDPVPKPVMRVAGSERAQLLIESANRKTLQEALEMIDQDLRQDSTGRISKTSRIRWLVERDPISI